MKRVIPSLLLGALILPGLGYSQETVWRKAQSASAPVRLGQPTVVRAQSAEELTLPPEHWPSTFGKDPAPRPLELPREPIPPIEKSPARLRSFFDKTSATSAEKGPAVEPTPFPASKEESKANVWTGLPLGEVWGQITHVPDAVSEWLVPDGALFQPPHRFEVSAEYLLWATRRSTYPPLATTDSPATVPEIIRGALPPTGVATVTFGGPQDPRWQSGARFGGTWWFDECGEWGLQGSYFFLGQRSDRFFDNGPVVARPFINALNGQETRELVSSPGTAPGDIFSLRGSLTIDAPSRLNGWDIALRHTLCCDPCSCWKADMSVGYRQLSLTEAVHITEDIISLKAVGGTNLLDPGNRIRVFDFFDTHNDFHGVQLGIRGEYRWERFTFEGKAKLGLGVVDQSVDIAGAQIIQRLNGQTNVFAGGLLALPGTNIGHFSQTRFGVVPEVGLKVNYQLTDNLRIFAGYDFLLINSVLRASEQIDRVVNPNLVPGLIIPTPPPTGPARPAVLMQTSSYWAQGVSFGLEFRY